MPSVTYGETTTNCATAIKGADYIHLLDDAGHIITAFDEVSDFTGFSIANGSWTTPATVGECYVAVIGTDGAVRTGNHKCNEISKIHYGTAEPAAYCTANSITPVAGMVYLKIASD